MLTICEDGLKSMIILPPCLKPTNSLLFSQNLDKFHRIVMFCSFILHFLICHHTFPGFFPSSNSGLPLVSLTFYVFSDLTAFILKIPCLEVSLFHPTISKFKTYALDLGSSFSSSKRAFPDLL